MQNADLWKSYDFYTSELTKHARQLGFAGIAVCWLFRSSEGAFPGFVLVGLLAFVGFFASDVLQYYGAAILLRFWTQREESRKHDETGTIEGEYLKPRWVDRLPFLLFNLKIFLLLGGFFALAVGLWNRSPFQASTLS